MSSAEDSQNQGFKVRDRRRFAPDGTPLEEGKKPEEKPQADDPVTMPPPPRSKQEDESAGWEVSFSGLVLSIAAGAQTGLGTAPHPLTGKVEVNLAQAKQSIDLLGLLAEKTKGNLSPEEDQLLQTLLYDLRMRFVEAQGRK